MLTIITLVDALIYGIVGGVLAVVIVVIVIIVVIVHRRRKQQGANCNIYNYIRKILL